MHMIMFSFHFRLLIFTWCILTPTDLQSISIGWKSLTDFSRNGFEFSPIDEQALFLIESNASSIMSCALTCHSTAQCRIYDFDAKSHRCRIFEGDITTMGTLIASASSLSRVGSIELYPEQFANQGQPCSFCQGSRYLTCINATCQCEPHTYFDGSMCQSQKLLGFECNISIECRSDLNYTCLPHQQCGPLSLQSGITIGGYGNGTGGNDLNALKNPIGLCLDCNGSIYIADNNNNRVIKLQEGSLFGTIFAGTGGSGSNATQLQGPAGLCIDTSSNIYIADGYNYRVMLWRQNSPTGILAAGNGIPGNSMSTFSTLGRLVVDSMGNLYVSDSYNHRVMKWAPNATSGTLVAGNGVAGNGSQQLNLPCGLYLDEYNSYLYIADSSNHRIQRYYLNGTLNATTVAGGNGPGTSSNQLNHPYGVYLSKKTGAIFIADTNNSRIQRWSPGATIGVTMAGTSGLSGASATLLSSPSDLILSLNETYLYVTDSANNRVQRFQLI